MLHVFPTSSVIAVESEEGVWIGQKQPLDTKTWIADNLTTIHWTIGDNPISYKRLGATR
jgi:hypothetical protein